MDLTFSPLLGIVGAAILGGAIGLQRQSAGKAAGFRTHLLVASAAAAFTAIGAHLNDTRIPSYIVVGIGFLGSGAIVRQGATTQGLTTAASIWMAAAIGMAMGYHSIFGISIALLCAVLTISALMLSDNDLGRLFGIRRKASLRVTCTSPSRTAQEVTALLRRDGIRFDAADIMTVDSEGGEEVAQILYYINLPPGQEVGGIIHDLAALSGVRRVESNEPSA
ncbi:MAG TPA: MgtC/SapB family protein [Candidatus Baltobacteraceae bacterium]|jgi:putative Mg2+ transporter-C (MgtC) family protein|nr:MgtC/SapB family protein [Candidatus Baltobacteraceae bacterium]